jgi:hypothetical protein
MLYIDTPTLVLDNTLVSAGLETRVYEHCADSFRELIYGLGAKGFSTAPRLSATAPAFPRTPRPQKPTARLKLLFHIQNECDSYLIWTLTLHTAQEVMIRAHGNTAV